jgi:hypothetical protein
MKGCLLKSYLEFINRDQLWLFSLAFIIIQFSGSFFHILLKNVIFYPSTLAFILKIVNSSKLNNYLSSLF